MFILIITRNSEVQGMSRLHKGRIWNLSLSGRAVGPFTLWRSLSDVCITHRQKSVKIFCCQRESTMQNTVSVSLYPTKVKANGNLSLCLINNQAKRAYGGVQLQHLAFFISALDGSGQLHALNALHLGKRDPSAHWS